MNISTSTKRTKQNQPMPDLNEFMPVDKAASLLNLHVVTVRNMLRSNKLEGEKIGGKTWLVSKKSVAEYLKKTEGMSKNDPRRRAGE